MKKVLAIAAVLVASPALADVQGDAVLKMIRSGQSAAAVPTGYQVPGSTFYKLDGARVVQVDCGFEASRMNAASRAVCFDRGAIGGVGGTPSIGTSDAVGAVGTAN